MSDFDPRDFSNLIGRYVADTEAYFIDLRGGIATISSPETFRELLTFPIGPFELEYAAGIPLTTKLEVDAASDNSERGRISRKKFDQIVLRDGTSPSEGLCLAVSFTRDVQDRIGHCGLTTAVLDRVDLSVNVF